MSDSETNTPKPRRRIGVFLPIAIFGALSLLFLLQLNSGDPSKIPSALIGTPVPEFSLPPVEGLQADGAAVPGFDSGVLQAGKVSIVNIWASWCVPCRDEHPFLVELGKDDRFALYGLNYKDEAGNARQFLGRYGNPFDAVGADIKGRVGIDWGVYGVPETFIIDRQGRIAYKHVGPLNAKNFEAVFLPQLEKVLAAQD